MPGPPMQEHHIISKDMYKTHDLLKQLTDRGLVDLEAPENKIDLPQMRADAKARGTAVHNGRPLSSYEDGIRSLLDDLKESPDFDAMKNGDVDAGRRLADKVDDLRDAARGALKTGDLLPNRLGEAVEAGRKAANNINNDWFDDYAKKVAQEAAEDAAKVGGGLLDDAAKLGLKVAGKIGGIFLDMILEAKPAGEGSDDPSPEATASLVADYQRYRTYFDEIKPPPNPARSEIDPTPSYKNDPAAPGSDGLKPDAAEKGKSGAVPKGEDPALNKPTLDKTDPVDSKKGLGSEKDPNSYNTIKQPDPPKVEAAPPPKPEPVKSSKDDLGDGDFDGDDDFDSDDDPDDTNDENDGGNHEYGGSHPVLLDLNGNGVEIMEVSRSNTFLDSADDGLLHRTAWAGAGDGVLFYDVPVDGNDPASGDGKITETREYVFTEWDPTAPGDLEAIASVFDTNGDSKLTAADEAFASFKVMVTNADGTTEAKTLAELGITEINLDPDATHIELPDGSVITGQTEYTKVVNGVTSTGIVANTTLSAEAQGHTVTQVVTTGAGGSETTETKAYDAGGNLAYAIVSTSSADGNLVNTSYDDNGDGTVDRLQSITTEVVSGVKTEMEVNSIGATTTDAVLASRQQTVTSADGKVITISRDSTGGGWWDSVEVRTTNADGSRTITTQQLAQDGVTVIASSTETVSIDGLERTEVFDLDGDTSVDGSVAHAISLDGNGVRTEVITTRAATYALRDQTTITTSADGKARTTTVDADGDGDADTIDATVLTLDGAGNSTSTHEVKNGDGSLRFKTLFTQTADALDVSKSYDMDGDGTTDIITHDVTSFNAGERTENLTVSNEDGSIQMKQKTVLAADKVASETWIDLNQDGVFQSTDLVSKVTVDGTTKNRTAESYVRSADGTLLAHGTTVTSEDGLTISSTTDADGDGEVDVSVSDVTVATTGAGSVQTIETKNGDSSLRNAAVVTTSSNGLTITTKSNIDGDGDWDNYVVSQTVNGAGGQVTRTTTEKAGDNATTLSKITIVESGDRLTKTTTIDGNGDGKTDSTVVSVKSASGAVEIISKGFNADGSLSSEVVTAVSANGLISDTWINANGDKNLLGKSVFETHVKDSTVYNADGSVTRTIDTDNGDKSDRSLVVTTTSDDGLTVVTQSDSDGNGVFERVTESVTVLNADGSKVTIGEMKNANGVVLSRSQAVVSDDGLVVTVKSDANGDGVYDCSVTSVTSLLTDGTTVVVSESKVGSTLLSKVTQSTSDDGRNASTSSDVNGDGKQELLSTLVIADNGLRTVTSSAFSANGDLQTKQVTESSGNGLANIVKTDADGKDGYESIRESVTVLNADGSVVTTVTDKAGNGAMFGQSVVVTSDDGLISTTTTDIDGKNGIDRTVIVEKILAQNGVETLSVTTKAANGATIDVRSVVTSADGRSVTETLDHKGDGKDIQTLTTEADNGTVTVSNTYYASGGAAEATYVTTVSGDGLTLTQATDRNADGRIDLFITDETALGEDGSVARSVNYRNDRYVNLGRAEYLSSDDGLVKSTAFDIDGDKVFDFITDDMTVHQNDGDTVRTMVTRDATSDILTTITSTLSGNGLNHWSVADYSGDGSIDRTTLTVKDADGASSETIKEYGGGYNLMRQSFVSVSADGWTRTANSDLNGDLKIDRQVVTVTDADRSVNSTYEDYGLDTLIKSRITSSEAANGMKTSYAFDFDADGVVEVRRDTVKSFGADGSVIEVFNETYGVDQVVFKETTTTSASGLESVTTTDSDGNGTVDGTTTTKTTLNADGSRTSSTETKYWNGDLRYAASTEVSADGRSMEETADFDGNGVEDKVLVTIINADGERVETETSYNEAGYRNNIFTTTTSADGLVTTIVRAGNEQTITRAALNNGSYVWDDGTTGGMGVENAHHVVSHEVDALGIETWTATRTYSYEATITTGGTSFAGQSSGGTTTTTTEIRTATQTAEVRLDEVAKLRIFAEAARSYDAIVDRGLDFSEYEILAHDVKDGQLDKAALATRLLDGGEFQTRYGNLSNAEFVTQIYLNALGRAPSLDEVDSYVRALASAALTKKEMAVEVAESMEHLVVGNGHMSTNNFDVIMNPVTYDRSLDLSYSRSIVANLVDVIYDRDATEQELSYLSDRLMRDVDNPDEIATILMGVEGAIQGVSSASVNGLTGAALVEQAFVNAFGRQPTALEQLTWEENLSSGRFTAAQFLASLGMSVDHLAAGNNHLNNSLPTVTTKVATDAGGTLAGTTGQDNMVGGKGLDIFNAGTGSDVLNGGLGKDTLRGDGGSDSYIWVLGDGDDLIDDNGTALTETDELVLSGFKATDVELMRVTGSDDLLIKVGGATLTIDQQFYSYGQSTYAYGLESIVFSDGVWSKQDILEHTKVSGSGTLTGTSFADILIGDDGSNTINASYGDDTLIGGLGSDTLQGSLGKDTYVWTKGDGKDNIYDTGTSITELDTLVLHGVAVADVKLSRLSGVYDLKINFAGSSTDEITITSRFYSSTSGYGIERIIFDDGTSWSLQDILTNTIVDGNVNGITMNGTSYDDVIIGDAAAETLDSGLGNDTLTGGKGVDTLRGDQGEDVYVWSKGDGDDLINDNSSTKKEVDLLVLTDVASGEIKLSRDNNSNNLKVVIGSETITVQNRFTSLANSYGIDKIKFSDGVIWTLNDIITRTRLDGTSAAETINGTVYDDNLFGNGGNDTIAGSGGSDLLVGGLGTDTLNGGDGNDRIEWSVGEGSDVISDTGTSLTEVDSLAFLNVKSSQAVLTKDANNLKITIGGEVLTINNRFLSATYGYGVEIITFSDGVTTEVLASPVAEAIITGTNAANTLNGWAFKDTIYGDAGVDVLNGNAGDDTLDGGADKDTLKGGDGQDTYVWKHLDGDDLIDDQGGSLTEIDTLQLTNVKSSDVELTRVSGNDDLLIKIISTNANLTIDQRFYNPAYGYGIESIQFGDGVNWSLYDILANTKVVGTTANNTMAGTSYRDNIYGLDGADTIDGNLGDDVIVGGLGNDTVRGDGGNDTYVWARGDGSDTLYDSMSSKIQTDTLKLSDVLASDLQLVRATGSYNLIATISGSGGGTITLTNQYYAYDNGYGIEAIEFADGQVWTIDDIWNNSKLNGTTANDSLSGTLYRDNIFGMDGNDTIYGGAGDDVIVGGKGADTLRGDAGNDTYRWLMNEGSDTIYDTSTSVSEVDMLVLMDVADTGVSLTKVGNDMMIKVLATSEIITITSRYYAVGQGYGIEALQFSNGTTWSLDDMLAAAKFNGTATAESLSGSNYADNIYGVAGNDTLYGNAGNDKLVGGLGVDTLNGGAGVDIVSYHEAAQGVKVDISKTTAQSGNAGGEEVGDIISYVEGLEGSNHGDELTGDANSNDIWGLNGNDTLVGADGYDRLYGGDGTDTLNGGLGADLLDGGLGNDVMTGGVGGDTFRFVEANFGSDQITDFEDGLDMLSFAASVADDFAEFSISNNGTSAVTVTFGSQSIVVAGTAAITLTADDFVFA